jgi:hypothetical protein
MRLTFVTTVSRSYLPLARIVMKSVAEQHPDSCRLILLLDESEAALEEHAQLLRPSDLITDKLELSVLQTIYAPIEYATALKPKLLMHALDSADIVFFVDPDMRLFQPMTSAIEAIQAGTGTLVTPHRTTAPAMEHRVFYEWTLKNYGTYNTGFVGVSDASLPMLQWWDSRLRRECLDDLAAPEWVDQRIMDLAPGYFDLDIFKDLGYNVGWWNLDERTLHRRDGIWYAGSEPLILMHYSGVRPNRPRGPLPQLVHSPQNPVAQDATHLDAIRELEDAYVADLMAAGYAAHADLSYEFGSTAGGHPLTGTDRRGYRSFVLAAEARGEAPPAPDDIPWGRFSRINRDIRTMTFPGALRRDARTARKLIRSY